MKKTKNKRRIVYLSPALDRRLRLEAIKRETNCSKIIVGAVVDYLEGKREQQ